MSKSDFMKRVRRQFSKLKSDLRYKRKTKRVRIFFAGISCLVLLIAIIIIVAVAGGKKNTEGLSMETVASQDENSETTEANQDANAPVEDGSSDLSRSEEISTSETVEEDNGIYLAEGPDAGEEYINETLFIGDSNTVRMMNYGLTSVDNTIAVVGMGIQSIKTLQCVQFSGYGSPVTMVEAVKLMQPKRIIITFGTNNATGMATDAFISQYDSALDAIHDAYPYADIIINSIPPMCKTNKYPKLSQTSIDDFNEGLKGLAEKKGYKYLDTASVMKDESTGFAKDGYTVNDGIHISDSGFAAMFTYIRTHAHNTEDTRPKPLAAVPKQQKATYVIDSSGKMNNDPNAYKEMSEVSKAEQEALKKAQEEALAKAAEEAKAKADAQANKANCTHPTTTQQVVREATESETGILRYTCTVCGHQEDVTIPKKEPAAHVHSYSEVSRTEATYDAPGKIVRRCSCGDEKVETIAQLARPETTSSSSEQSSSTEQQPSTSTTETPAHEHSYEETSRTEATYDAPGKIVKTCSCGDVQEETIPQLTPPADSSSSTETQTE